jgi:hypothetical protein
VSGTSSTSTSWLLISWSKSSTGPLKDGVVTTKVTQRHYQLIPVRSALLYD